MSKFKNGDKVLYGNNGLIYTVTHVYPKKSGLVQRYTIRLAGCMPIERVRERDLKFSETQENENAKR